MGFWSGITDFINDGFDSIKDAFSSVKDSVSDVASYVSDAFTGVYNPHDKTDDKEYEITPIEDKNHQYDLWLRSEGFDILPDYDDYFKHY